jgi:hypothetical protein
MKSKKIGVLSALNHPLTSSGTCIEWSSTQSLFDFDVLIISAALAVGADCESPFARADMYYPWKRFQSRLKEIISFMEHGRPVIALVENYPLLLARDRNGDDTRVDVHELLYASKMDITSGTETEIAPGQSKCLQAFLDATRKRYSYKGVLKTPYGQPLLKIRGTNKVLASYVWSNEEKRLFLPALSFSGLGSAQEVLIFINQLSVLVDALDAGLSRTVASLPPGHIRYQLPKEGTLRGQKAMLEAEIAAANVALEQVQGDIGVEESYKHLFLSNGDSLVDAVRRALTDLGFTVVEGPVGRDDLICECIHGRAVVEVKGRENKSAAEKDSAQLEKWAARELEEMGVAAKPILVVNGFCQVPLEERIEPVFPHQMLGYATRRDHCLCTGLDLLALSHVARSDPAKKEEIQQQLLNTVGVFSWDQMPKWDTVISINSDTVG